MQNCISLSHFDGLYSCNYHNKNIFKCSIYCLQGDLDILVRNASKYDDIRFLHLPNLRMEWDIKWLCKDGANPNNHHHVEPCAPDKVQGKTFESFIHQM